MRNTATTGKRTGYGWLYSYYCTYRFRPWQSGFYYLAYYPEDIRNTHCSYGGIVWRCIQDVTGSALYTPPNESSSYWEYYMLDLDIAPIGWRIPFYGTDLDLQDDSDLLINYLGANSGGKTKSVASEWLSPNTGAINSTKLSILPSGWRDSTGVFRYIRERSLFWTTFYGSPYGGTWNVVFISALYNSGDLTKFVSAARGYGVPIRCVQNKLSGEVDGDTGTVTDIDGNVYSWVVIGSLRWMTENLRVTRFNNNVVIPEITDNTEWSNLSLGINRFPARCAYNHDHYLVYPAER